MPISPLEERVLTGPIALIKAKGIVIGKIKDIRCTETIRRGRVTGIGELTPSELPPLEWTGTLTIGSMLIDLKKSMIPGVIVRSVQDVGEWVNAVLLQENGVDIDILRRVKISEKKDPSYPAQDITYSIGTGTVQNPARPSDVFATIRGVFLNRESFNLSEGQIAGRDIEAEYLDPILYPQ